MDLLFSKYASPFLFMDGMIQAGRFAEFVDEFVKMHNEETEEQKMWELYLHKVFNKSYNEFKESINSPEPVEMSSEQFETTFNNSKSVLKNFNPN